MMNLDMHIMLAAGGVGAGVGIAFRLRLGKQQFLSIWLQVKVYLLARVVRSAGYTRHAVETAERALLIAVFSILKIADPELVDHSLEYLRLAGDAGKTLRPRSYFALLVVMALDSAILASMLLDALLIDASFIWRLTLSIIVGCVGGALGGMLTHVAGQRFGRYVNLRAILRKAAASQLPLPDDVVSFNWAQAADSAWPPFARQWMRVSRGISLWPIWFAAMYVAIIGASGFELRYEQYLALVAQAVPNLANKSSMIVSLCVVLVIFFVVQISMFMLGYHTVLLGLDSRHAIEQTWQGQFRSAVEAQRYNNKLEALAARLQSTLHNYLLRWSSLDGIPAPQSVLSPKQILAELLANPPRVPVKEIGQSRSDP